jgi:hypothetical protein
MKVKDDWVTDPPNLSGTWKPDPAASTVRTVVTQKTDGAPPADDPMHATERIRQAGGTITIDNLDAAGGVINTIILTTDGREMSSAIGDLVVHKSLTRWVGSELHVDWLIERHGTPSEHGSDARTLSDDGQTQRLERNVSDGASRSFLVVILRRVP